MDCLVPGRAGTALQADLSFSYTYSGPLGSSSTTVTDIQTTYTIAGRFGTPGEASGTVAISSIAFTYDGERYTCSQNPVPWNAKKQPGGRSAEARVERANGLAKAFDLCLELVDASFQALAARGHGRGGVRVHR